MALLAHYKLNGNARDSMRSNDGIPVNVSWVSGKLGSSCGSFNGTNSYIGFSQGSLVLHHIRPFTISFWINLSEIPSNGNSFNILTIETYGGFFGFGVGQGGNYNGLFFGSSGTFVSRRTDSIPTVGQWNFITISYSGGDPTSINNFIFYLNGDICNTESSESWSSDNKLLLGARSVSESLSHYYNGLIDDVRIYDHVLSMREIKELSRAKIFQYRFSTNHSLITDSSGQDNHFKLLTPVPIWEENSPIGRGCYRIQPHSEMFIGDLIPLQEHTLCFWIKLNVGYTGSFRMLFCNGDGRNPTIWFFNNSNNLHWSVRSGGNNLSANTYFGMDVGKWYFAGGTWSSGDNMLRVYMGSFEGNLLFNEYGNVYAGTPLETSSSGWIRFLSGSADSDWSIADARLYTTSLSEDEIRHIYGGRVGLDREGNLHALGSYQEED